MAETKYSYDMTDFLNDQCSVYNLKNEIDASSIIVGLKEITAYENSVDITFKDAISVGEKTTLDGIVSSHTGIRVEEDEPHMPDGRPIVRSDTRPLDTQTYFTCSGDDEDIGDGVEMKWDFSNDDNLIPSGSLPSGFKGKEIKMKFHCPVYPKDGSIYFFDAPWGQYMYMDICVPSGSYYPNPEGAIPAAALGLPGNDMYSQAPSGSDVVISRYVNKHFCYGNCPMGDELNAEGASVDAIPVGWILRGIIITPEDDNTSKGYASLELYRCHTTLLPGQSIEDLH